MGNFNSLLATRYADAVRRLFGEEIDLNSVAPEIIPVFTIEGDDPEFALLKEERLWSFSVTLPAVAAVVNGLLVQNPAGSNQIITLEEAQTNGDQCKIWHGQGALPANYSLFDGTLLNDLRTMGKGVATMQRGVGLIYTKILGAATAAINFSWTTASTVYTPRRSIIHPGGFAAVEGITVNTAVTLNFGGRERKARPEELGGF